MSPTSGHPTEASEAPSLLNLATTSQCNLACQHCTRSMPEVAARADAKPDMTPEVFDTLVAQILPSIEHVILGGPNLGEPTVSPLFDEHLDRLARGTRRPHMAVQTNGTGLTRARLERCVELGARLLVSMEGITPESYESMRGWPLERLVKAFDIFNELRAAHPGSGAELYISSYMVRYDTLRELVPLVDFALEHSVDVVAVTQFSPYRASQADQSLCLHREEANEAFARAAAYARERGVTLVLPEPFGLEAASPDEPARPRTPCYRPWTSTVVTESGDVKPCPVTHQVVGNLRDEPFERIWNGSGYREFRERVNSAEPLADCRGCCMRGIHVGGDPTEQTFYTDPAFLLRHPVKRDA